MSKKYPDVVMKIWLWLRTYDQHPTLAHIGSLYPEIIKSLTGYDMAYNESWRLNTTFTRELPIRKGFPIRLFSYMPEFEEVEKLIEAHRLTKEAIIDSLKDATLKVFEERR